MHPQLERPAEATACSRSERLYADHLSEIIREMRRDPARGFQTSLTSMRLGVSASSFIRAFKSLTGISPQRFHSALRIALAKTLLVETNQSVTNISLEVGYNSLGTFTRTFTVLVGVSPRHFRRLARGKEGAIPRLSALTLPPTSLPMLHAAIEAPLPPDLIIAAGLFPQGLPAGLPFDGCFVDPRNPRFSLAYPPGRQRQVLLVAAANLLELQDAWSGNPRDAIVCSIPLSESSRRAGGEPLRVHLRPMKETDPPFLTPVPLLIMLQAKRARVSRLRGSVSGNPGEETQLSLW
jgi:AraC-like DNA-binding protein